MIDVRGKALLPDAWIFQAGEAEYDLWAAAHDLADDVWLASRGARDMRPGQTVYFWKAGRLGGLFAVGELTGFPATQSAPDYQLPYWPPASRDNASRDEVRVPVRYVERLPRGAITRARLRTDPILSKQQPVAPVHVGTNFKVSASAHARLQDLIAEARA